jgi:hypothetical protein
MKLAFFALLFVFAVGIPLRAQYPSTLEARVASLENNVRQLPSEGLVLFLFGAFCALWAKNTGRNAWLWFFIGLFFSILAVIVLLNKNSEDRRQAEKKPFDLQDFRKQ